MNPLPNFNKIISRHRSILAVCFRLTAVILCCLVLISCGGAEDIEDIIDDFIQEPDAEPVRATIKTAVPLAHFAAVAMEAVQGESSPEVITTSTCDAYPCLGLVLIEFDPQNLPFDCNDIFEVLVAGLWTSSNSAVLTVSFIDAYAGVATFPVSKISTFPVIKSSNPDDGYRIVYADIDINIDTEPDDTVDLNDAEVQTEYDRLDVVVSDDSEVNLSLDAWVVELADAGTPTYFADDRYTVSGGGEYIGVISNHSSSSANIMQLGLANIFVSNECSYNPTDGFAVINELAVSSGSHGSFPIVATALIGFDGGCRRSAQVLLATGNYIASNGTSIDFDLNH